MSVDGARELEDDRDSDSLYRFSRKDMDAVNCTNWYERFKEICPKTKFLTLPPEVLKYLKSDEMFMPPDTHTTAQFSCATVEDEDVAHGDEEDNGSWASISDNEEAPPIPSEFLQRISREGRGERGDRDGQREVGEEAVEEYERTDNESSDESECDRDGVPGPGKRLEGVEKFHDFDLMLDATIRELGGAVLAKVNRKSPKDAVWIGFNRSLKCYNPGDIYLLMKTSDVVSNLLEDPYRECGSIDSREEEAVDGAAGALPVATSTTPYVLVLKEWNDSWGPDMEFRCFICANQLIAICQRDMDTCYSSIVRRKDKLLLNIQNFFLRNISEQFPIDFYVMDIVCHPNGEIYLVDFDVFGTCTDPLLFTYQEIQSMYESTLNVTSRSMINHDDNKLCESLNHRSSSHQHSPGQPCLRFLTESRNFRARKSPGHPALTNDVMTYIRESVSKK